MSRHSEILRKSILVSSAFYPAAWLAGVFIFTLQSWVYLGYWPRPSHPDPKNLLTESFHNFLFVGFFLLVPSIFIYLIAAWNRKYTDLKHLKKIHFVGWIAIIVFLIIPKFNFVAWFLD